MGWPVTQGPIQPVITSTSAGGTSVTVSWKDRNIRTGLPADRFSLEAYQGSTKVSSTSAAGTARSGVVTGLTANVTYQIRVVPITNNKRGTAAVKSVNTGSGPVFEEPDEIPAFVRERWLDHQIFRVYQAHFLRAPEKVGFYFWRDQRAAGVSLLAITTEFQASTEFINRYGTLTDGEFVMLVYNNVLGRNPDSIGFNHWTGQLAGGMSRAEMMVGFAESTEYVRRTSTIAPQTSTEGSVLRLYKAYFLREPSSTNQAYWVGVAESGTPLVSIADFFSASTEFVNTYGSLSDGAFVNLVYMNVLGRPADSIGFSHWTGQLAAGMSRGEVMLGFSESVEFIRSTGTIP